MDKGSNFKSFVLQNFQTAAKAFEDQPDDVRWTDLKVAMWAWQHVQSMPTNELKDAADHWVMEIAARAKGDNDFSE